MLSQSHVKTVTTSFQTASHAASECSLTHSVKSAIHLLLHTWAHRIQSGVNSVSVISAPLGSSCTFSSPNFKSLSKPMDGNHTTRSPDPHFVSHFTLFCIINTKYINLTDFLYDTDSPSQVHTYEWLNYGYCWCLKVIITPLNHTPRSSQ